MAYMCADSGNLMAIAQQVIQQQQQRQQQQQQTLTASSSGAPPWGSHYGHDANFPFVLPDPVFADSFPTGDQGLILSDERGPFKISDFRCGSAAAEFESDEWMESLIGDSPTESSDLPCLFSDDPFAVADVPASIPPPYQNIPPPPPISLINNAPVNRHTLTESNTPLLRSLLDCAFTADTNPDLAIESLNKIRNTTSETGDPTQRVAFYFSEALKHRLTTDSLPLPPPPPAAAAAADELTICFKHLNDACPYSKFAHLTANQAILEATESASRIHIVDFGIRHGIQWAALLQALSTRSSGKPELVRITGIPLLAEFSGELPATGRRLAAFAEQVGLKFKFEVVKSVTDLDLTTSPMEIVAVNFMLQLHHLLSESTESVERVVRVAKSLNPSVVTLGEYELAANRASYADRFAAALAYYAAVFDSLEPAMGRGSAERALVERVVLGTRIGRSVGRDQRLRMEEKNTWRDLMEKCGFVAVQMSHYAVSQAKLLLWNYDYSPKYELIDTPPGFLSLAWDGRQLITVSAWR